MSYQYIIMKSSRSPAGDVIREQDAYAGSTCQPAGVRPGQVYATLQEASDDARKLSKYNPVGFCVRIIGVTFVNAQLTPPLAKFHAGKEQ